MSGQNQFSTDYLSLGKVLEEAMQEICCLEEKNSQMQDVLKELQSGVHVLGVNDSTHNITNTSSQTNTSTSDVKVLQAENNQLLKQLCAFKQLSETLSIKLKEVTFDNSYKVPAENGRQSSLSELKRKLSTSSTFIQKFIDNHDSSLSTKTDLSNQNCNLQKSSNLSSILDQSGTDELHRQLNDALEKNIQWQSYNEEREQYVSLLLSKYNQNCADLQKSREQLAILTSKPDKLAIEQRRYFDKLLVTAKQELETQRCQTLQVSTELSIMKENHKEEIERLDSNIEHWRKRYEEQRETLAALHANYENERRRSNNNAVESKEKQSQIQILQKQVHLFGEDFRTERNEKEIAQQEVSTLKQKVNQLEADMKHYQATPCKPISNILGIENIPNRHSDKTNLNAYLCVDKGRRKAPPPPPNQVNTFFKKNSNDYSSPITTRRRDAKKPNPATFDIKKDVAGTSPQRLASTKKAIVTSESKSSRKRMSDSDKLLLCPNCEKQYNIDEHMLLLEHIDTCGD